MESTVTYCSINPACIVTAEIGSEICNFFNSSQAATGNPLNHFLLKHASWVKAAKSTLRIKRNRWRVLTPSDIKTIERFKLNMEVNVCEQTAYIIFVSRIFKKVRKKKNNLLLLHQYASTLGGQLEFNTCLGEAHKQKWLLSQNAFSIIICYL